MNRRLPHIVIIGAGFGGLKTAQALKGAPVDVTLVDARNHHTFQPLLYQVATAALDPEEIAHSVRGIFHKQRNLRFRMASVTGVDWSAKQVLTEADTPILFDYLIVAAGAVTNDFGVPGVREHAFGLKALDEAVDLRSHIMRQFELADANPDRISAGALTFVAVGGGPTGVEMAGALAELFRHVLARDYPRIDMARVRVILLEAGERLLAPFHPSLSADTLRQLQARGVDVRFAQAVVEVTADGVRLKDGTFIPAHTVVWSAGVKVSPLAAALGVPTVRGGRLAVNDDLSLPDHPDAFAVGDIAAGKDAAGVIYPQLAQAAMQSGAHAARQILRRLAGQPGQTFAYRDPGTMATIGRNAAVVQFPFGARFTGLIAWLMWVFLHLMYLVGFRNRLNVFVNWVFNYVWHIYGGTVVFGEKSERERAALTPSLPSRS
jgi:NADH:ubiquinone reductase (H+-translocating)